VTRRDLLSNRYYFYDLKRRIWLFVTDKMVEVIMIWAFIMHGMKSDIVFAPTTLNSVSYQDLLEGHLIPLKHKLGRKSVIINKIMPHVMHRVHLWSGLRTIISLFFLGHHEVRTWIPWKTFRDTYRVWFTEITASIYRFPTSSNQLLMPGMKCQLVL